MLQYLSDPDLVYRFQKFCGVSDFDTQTEVQREAANNKSQKLQAQVKSYADAANRSESQADLKKSVTPSASRKHVVSWVAKHVFEQNGAVHRAQLKEDMELEDSKNSIYKKTTYSCKSAEKDQISYKIAYPKLDALFRFGTGLGNEVFFITFLPFWYWNIDGYVARHVSIFWAIFMYIGQMTKDLIKWPRPGSPPVFRLDSHLYVEEYGFPSTHAMGGAGIPFAIFLLTAGRYQYPWALGLLISVLWASLVGASRVYLGMHSVLDVLAGSVYPLLLIPVVFPLLEPLDHFLLNHPISPLVIIMVGLLLCVYYPSSSEQGWSTTWADTTIIIGVSSGVCFGHWLNHQWSVYSAPVTPPPYPIIMPDATWLLHTTLRMVIGPAVLFVVRYVVKMAVFKFMCYYNGVDPKSPISQKMPAIQLPQKFVTYISVSVTCVVFVPYLFRSLGIGRVTAFTEG